MANVQRNGFRYWGGSRAGSAAPLIEWRDVVSNYGSDFYEGFAARIADDGTAEITPGTEGTPGLVYAVVTAIGYYWDAAQGRMIPPLGAAPKYLPSGTVYGTSVDKTSKVGMVKAKGAKFYAQADAALATPTRAGALALRGTTGDHVISGSDMALDISDFEAEDASPTDGQWTIIDIVEDAKTDFTASRLGFIVEVNENMFQEAGAGL